MSINHKSVIMKTDQSESSMNHPSLEISSDPHMMHKIQMSKYTNDPLHEKKCLKSENGCVCTDSVCLFSESYTYLDNNKPACTNKAVWHSQKSSTERAQHSPGRLCNSTLFVFAVTDGNSFAYHTIPIITQSSFFQIKMWSEKYQSWINIWVDWQRLFKHGSHTPAGT